MKDTTIQINGSTLTVRAVYTTELVAFDIYLNDELVGKEPLRFPDQTTESIANDPETVAKLVRKGYIK